MIVIGLLLALIALVAQLLGLAMAGSPRRAGQWQAGVLLVLGALLFLVAGAVLRQGAMPWI